MKKWYKKISILLVFALLFSTIGDISGGMTARAATGYTVTFKPIGKASISMSVNPGERITSIPDLTPKSSTKKYYWLSDNGSRYYNNNGIAALTINGNYTFTEKYDNIQTYTVTFKYGDKTIEKRPVESGEAIGTLPAQPAPELINRNNATFAGWRRSITSTPSGVSSYAVYPSTRIASDLTVNALYTYSVFFATTGKTFTMQYGTPFTYTILPAEAYEEAPSSDNSSGASVGNAKQFLGWYDAETGGNKCSEPDGKFSEKNFSAAQTTLYPRWSTPSGKYEVTLQVAGLSGATEDIVFQNVAENAVILSYPEPTLAGHTLTKWVDANNEEIQYKSNKKYGSDATKIKQSVTLKPVFEINKHSVQFNYRTRNTDIPDSEIDSTDLNTLYKKDVKALDDITYGSTIPKEEIPSNVAQEMRMKFFAPTEEGSEELTEYTAICTYNGKWKTGTTEWNFDTDTVSSDMLKSNNGDSSLHPCYDITYLPHTPPADYQYDEDSIFDTKTCNVTFSYLNTSGTAAADPYQVKYGRTIPQAAYPNSKVLPTKVSTFYDKISKDSTDYIEFTATYTFTGKWIKNGTGVIWAHDRFVTEDNLELVPLYSVKFEPFTPDSDIIWDGSSEDIGDSIDKIESKYSQVTFDHNNGSGKTTKIKVPKSQPLDPDIAPKVTKAGVKFTAWALDKEGTQLYDWDTEGVPANLTLYAIWAEQGDVAFNSDGGSYLSVETIVLGQPVPEPEEKPVKKGYIFLGWSKTRQKNRLSTDYEKYAYDFDTPVTKNDLSAGQMKLWAWYQSDTRVRFYYNKSAEDDTYKEVSLEIAKDGSFLFPEYVPETENAPENMIFTGWFTSRTGGNRLEEQNFRPDPASTSSYYAQWTDGFKITYILDAGTNESKTVSYKVGETPSPITVEPKDGKVVTGWYLDAACQESANIPSIAKDTTVYAKWETIAPGDTVTITLDANGGTFKDNSNKKAVSSFKAGARPSENALEIPAGPSGKELVFTGWYLSPDDTNPIDFSSYYLQGPVTFYAKWGYEVRFEPNNSVITTGIPNQYVGEGKTLSEPPELTHKDYILIGWSEKETPESSSDFWDFDNEVVTKKTTLYAIWGVSIIFDANGGYFEDPEWGKVKSKEVEITASNYVEELKTQPLYPSCAFTGWYKDPFAKEKFEFLGSNTPTRVTSSIRVYAGWEEDNIEYTIGVEGGKASHSASLAGKRVAVIARIPEGKLFVRWEGDGVDFRDKTSQTTTFLMPTQNVEIHAVFMDDPSVVPEPSPSPTPSTGGGSSSGGSYTPPEPTEEPTPIIPVDLSKKSGKASMTIADSQIEAAIEAALLQKALDEAENAKNPQATVILNVTKNDNVSQVTTKLTEDAMKRLIDANIDVLELQDTSATIKLDNKALKEVDKKTTGDVSLVLGASTQKLSSSVEKAIGKRPVIKASIQYKNEVDGKKTTKKITKLSSGKIEIHIPYTPTKAEKKLGTKKMYGVYINSKGKAYYVKNRKYDSKEKELVFKIDQLGSYGITYKK